MGFMQSFIFITPTELNKEREREKHECEERQKM